MKNYPGNKGAAHVYRTIINQIPQIKVFTEVFAGYASITRELQKIGALPEFVNLNDIDPQVQMELGTMFNLANLNITSHDFRWYIDCAGPDEFLFLDPPYKHETRPNSTSLYRYELNDFDHVQLLETVLQLKQQIAIIHPKCDLYDKYLKDWRQIEILIRYHNKTSREILYMNYPADLPLQTTKYVGSDCWKRQGLKRKGDRLLNKIKALPKAEQQYLIDRLKEIKIH